MTRSRLRTRARLLAVGSAAALAAALPVSALPTASADSAATGSAGLSIARVSATTDGERERLLGLGLDVLEFGPDEAEVLLGSGEDRRALAATGLDAQVVDVTDQAEQLARQRAEEDALQAAADRDAALESPLPTGRVSYRTIEEAEAEIREIAHRYPAIVKLFELPNRSLLGRPVLGLEISREVHAASGKPVFLTTGVHHAREWPTLELTLEFAWDVVQSYGTDPEITGLLDSTRLVVVPVVNPDGFDVSRDLAYEMKRKNCRMQAGQVPTAAECASTTNQALGVDLNRNYGPFWGGPGSSANVRAENHHGAHPYSEPEIQNMSALMSAHQVMVALNNHTPDARLLRAPSSPLEPVPTEEELYDGLAQQLGAALSFPAGPWPEVYYVASGVAEEHGLYVNGTLGFTPELTPGHTGLARFHPPYEYVVDQYFGTGYYAGSSLRKAFLIAWRAAADPAKHSVLTGTAPRGAELTIRKQVTVDSSPLADGAVLQSDVEVETTIRVPADGAFEWHVLPSLRQSQYSSTLIPESWTVSCTDWSGEAFRSETVTIARGQSARLDLGDCPVAGVPDIEALLESFHAEGTISDRTRANLRERLDRALASFRTGSEIRTIGFLRQFVARAENQVKGDARDLEARAELVGAADALIAALEAAEEAES
ncbi:zinc carboxypeptidase [Motilibacter deserti]|uniref:Zinc carboxypeptidase n=1 Tax=Motilibacter deserti TaxID=2714956 RepID=A0ABX0GWJ0_9ACTN|nr:zinc carboxypeptidase [Motilibacter deserti]NHC14466.1 zinc carboxypeptidase [Motilibacter deserti]